MKKYKYKCPVCDGVTSRNKRPKALPYHAHPCHALMEPVRSSVQTTIRWSVKGTLACPECGCQGFVFGVKCPNCDYYA